MSLSLAFDGTAIDGTISFFFFESILPSEDCSLLVLDFFPMESFEGVFFFPLELLAGIFFFPLEGFEGGVFLPLEVFLRLLLFRPEVAVGVWFFAASGATALGVPDCASGAIAGLFAAAAKKAHVEKAVTISLGAEKAPLEKVVTGSKGVEKAVTITPGAKKAPVEKLVCSAKEASVLKAGTVAPGAKKGSVEKIVTVAPGSHREGG
jgi:hypothetical protein